MAILNMKILSFKTYRKVESIPFSPFTCIVGPNGVGKSNLVDALLFVLGASPHEIRGSLPARDCPPPTQIEISFRNRNGAIIILKRELVNEISAFYIDGMKVSFSEYAAYLESHNISTTHRNFLISQNEALIKSPKELSRFIDAISGSSAYKEIYKELKDQKDLLTKEYREVLERKRAAEISVKAYEEVVDMQNRHRTLIARRRTLASSKIKKRRAHVQEVRKGLVSRLSTIKGKENSESLQGLHKEIAVTQAALIKCRAIKAGIEHRKENKNREAQRTHSADEKETELQKVKEQISEARAQIDDCEWRIKKTEELSQTYPGWNEKYQRDVLVQALTQIQRVEDSKSILQMKIQLEEIRREIKETVQKEREQKSIEDSEAGSTHLAHLNQSLLETLKELSSRVAHSRDADYSSRLGYLVSRIKGSIPQIVGRLGDLVSCTDSAYQTAINALIHAKRNIVVIEQEKHALPILNGLSQSGAGRVTILPINRLSSSTPKHPCSEKENEDGSFYSESDTPVGYIRCSDVIRLVPCVKCDSSRLINYICGRSLIYLGTGSPSYTAEKVVTLDGVIISKEGMVRRVDVHGSESAVRGLEEKRDRLLEEIKMETQAQKTAQREKISDEKSEAVEALEKKYIEAKTELSQAEAEIKEQIDKIVANSQIPHSIIKQAKEEGVIDSSSAHRKAEQIKKKELSWRNRLDVLTQTLSRLEKIPTTLEVSTEESTEGIDQDIMGLEQKLTELSGKIEPSAEIEVKVIKEQILVLDDEIEEIEQYMAEEGLSEETINEAPDSVDEDDLEKLEREIASLAGFLSKKGVVSETHQMYAQLEKEAEEKKNMLSEVTKEFQKVRKERTSLFLSVFDRINTLINQHYARLTENPAGHVRAHLGLENSLEPYLAGIQIFVMPTGKTFREAKYLSGGEKTMVALSLLLAVNSIYPSLFYIFDELDAALDKDKICSLRESLQEINAQFIAVTHRIELFENADTLIGVARPPKGHSQIFSLKL
ncbi:structural maintenance of chromosome 1 [Nematocida ausubeli]|nr:structural maintenance of chromosome 1 [Nematocida ausubeli]